MIRPRLPSSKRPSSQRGRTGCRFRKGQGRNNRCWVLVAEADHSGASSNREARDSLFSNDAPAGVPRLLVLASAPTWRSRTRRGHTRRTSCTHKRMFPISICQSYSNTRPTLFLPVTRNATGSIYVGVISRPTWSNIPSPRGHRQTRDVIDGGPRKPWSSY